MDSQEIRKILEDNSEESPEYQEFEKKLEEPEGKKKALSAREALEEDLPSLSRESMDWVEEAPSSEFFHHSPPLFPRPSFVRLPSLPKKNFLSRRAWMALCLLICSLGVGYFFWNKKNLYPSPSATLHHGIASCSLEEWKHHASGSYSASSSKTIPALSIPGFAYLGKLSVKCQCGKEEFFHHHYRHLSTGIEMILLPGYFQKEGIPSKLRWISRPYLIARKETTQKIWKEVMGSEPWKHQEKTQEGNDYPAVYISWKEAKDFCEKKGLDLPTKDQWDYACQNKKDQEISSEKFSWFAENTWILGKHPQKTGQKKPNLFGLYDMMGNVREWCEDQWGKDFQQTIISIDETCRIVQGGSWFDSRSSPSLQLYAPQNSKDSFTGFRAVYNLK